MHVRDVTSGLPMLALMGPKRAPSSQKYHLRISRMRHSPSAQARRSISATPVRASRLTYVGEQGYEIYMPAEFAAHVFDELLGAGTEFGLRMGGFFAINSLRMEKGYRHWGHDIGEEDTPFQAGLGFAVALGKPGGFTGREALLRQKAEGPLTRRMVLLRLPGDTAPSAPPQRTDPARWHDRRNHDNRCLGTPRLGLTRHGLRQQR